MKFMNLPDDILRLIAKKSIKSYPEQNSYNSRLYSQIYDSNHFFKDIGYKAIRLCEPPDDIYGIYLWSLNGDNTYYDPF